MLRFSPTMSVIAAMTIAMFPSTAKAEDAKIKDMSFSITVPFMSEINVTSSDGTKWDKIRDESIPLRADINVDTKHPGYVERAGIFLGACNNAGCKFNPRTRYWAPMSRDWRFNDMFAFDIGKIPATAANISGLTVGNDIISGCNAYLTADGATTAVSFTVEMYVSLSVNTRKGASMRQQFIQGTETGTEPDFNGGDVTKQAAFRLKVNCIASPQRITAPLYEITSFTVRADQSDNTCPKDYRLAVSFRRNRQPTEARANVKFHIEVDGKRRARIVRTMSRQSAFFSLTYGETLKLSPGAHTIRVVVEDGPTSETITRQVTCPPFAASAMWLTIDQQNKSSCPKDVRAKVRITANGPGTILTKIKNQAGAVMAIEPIKVERKGNEYEGLLKQTFRMGEIDTMLIAENVNNTGQNTGWQPLKITCLKPIKGTLTLQDPDAPDCSRQARAAISIQTTTPGKVPFQLSCSGGRNLTGRLDAHQTAPGTFLAVRVKTFTIDKNEHINCALKTKVDGAWKTVALQGRQFQCVKRPDAAGPNSVTTPVHPTHDKPDRMPPVVVTPEPPRTMVDCARGFTKVGRRCVRITCPRGEKLINGRCIQRIVECLRGFKKVGESCVRVTCQRGEKLVGDRCIPRTVECLQGFKKVGQSCIRITCQRGERLVNGHCKAITVSCPHGYTKLRGKCIKPATRPVKCANGRLVHGRCVTAEPAIRKRGNAKPGRNDKSRKVLRRN